MKTKLRCIILVSFAILIILIAVFAPYITSYDPDKQELAKALMAPCKEHLFGTDRYGRDMLSRVIIGARSSVFSALSVVLVTTIFGAILGMGCGYYGGFWDNLFMRITDIFLAFPGMVFAIAVAGVLGGGILNAIFALAFISWPKYARLARSQVLKEKNNVYIDAAKLSGASNQRVLIIHILPNIAGTIVLTSMQDIGTMLMEIAGLSFLGLGAMPPTAEWGSMMSNGRSMIQTAPWVILVPGFAIFITVLVFNLLGDSIRDLFDSRQRNRGEKIRR